jgi:hypothetical protein
MTVSTASHSFDLELHHLSSTIYTKLDAITLAINGCQNNQAIAHLQSDIV